LLKLPSVADGVKYGLPQPHRTTCKRPLYVIRSARFLMKLQVERYPNGIECDVKRCTLSISKRGVFSGSELIGLPLLTLLAMV